MSSNIVNTFNTLKRWEQMADESSNDTRPMAPDYFVLQCSTEGCDSYQLNDVFCPCERLNCQSIESNGIVNGKVVFECDKHTTK